MTEGLLGTILSAVIAGVFSLIAKRMELNASKAEAPPGKQPAVGTINQSAVLRHIGIIQFIVNLSGFLVGSIFGPTPAFVVAQFLFGSIVAIAGFCWAALQVQKTVRWNHLILVAIGVSISTLIVNSILFGSILPLFTPAAYMFAFAQAFLTMILGGFVANMIKG